MDRLSIKEFFLILLMTIVMVGAGPPREYSCALSYGLFTHHYRSKAANEGFENRMFAFEYKHLVISEFSNSYNEETVFIGYGWHTSKFAVRDQSNWWVRGNLYTGALIGYGDKNPANIGGIGLGVYPTASIGYKQISIEPGVMPTFIWFGLKFEF